jgi:hypothetical protein
LPELCSVETNPVLVDVDPAKGESTLVADEGGAFTTTLAVWMFTEHVAGKARSQTFP